MYSPPLYQDSHVSALPTITASGLSSNTTIKSDAIDGVTGNEGLKMAILSHYTADADVNENMGLASKSKARVSDRQKCSANCPSFQYHVKYHIKNTTSSTTRLA